MILVFLHLQKLSKFTKITNFLRDFLKKIEISLKF